MLKLEWQQFKFICNDNKLESIKSKDMRGRKKDLVIKQKRKYITIVGKLPLQKEKKKKKNIRIENYKRKSYI